MAPGAAARFVALPLQAAAAARWARGRALFGPRWHGEDPLLELYEELADAFNYTRENSRGNGGRTCGGTGASAPTARSRRSSPREPARAASPSLAPDLLAKLRERMAALSFEGSA